MQFTDSFYMPSLSNRFRLRISSNAIDSELLMNQVINYDLKSDTSDTSDEIGDKLLLAITYEIDYALATLFELIKLKNYNTIKIEIFAMDGGQDTYHSLLKFDGKMVSMTTGQNYANSEAMKANLLLSVSNPDIRLTGKLKKLDKLQ